MNKFQDVAPALLPGTVVQLTDLRFVSGRPVQVVWMGNEWRVLDTNVEADGLPAVSFTRLGDA